MVNNQKMRNIEDIVMQMMMIRQTTKSVIGQRTGLSNTTVSDSINEMLDLGVIKETGREKSEGGRKSVIYSLNGEYGKFLGIAMDEAGVDAVVTDASGKLLEQKRYGKKKGETSIGLLRRVSQKICEDKGSFLAIGIGVPGVVDEQGQIVIHDERLGWRNVPLKELMERTLYIPTYIDNAINGLAVWERCTYRSMEKRPGFVLIDAKHPYNAAVMAQGRIVRGNLEQEMVWNYEGLMRESVAAAKILGLKEIVTVSSSPEELQGNKDPLIRVVNRKMKEGGLGYGMALSAQMDWFHSVYFLLKSNH